MFLRHENSSLVGGDLVDTGEQVSDGVLGAHIRAQRDNGDNLGGAVLAIEDLGLSEQLLALLLLQKSGSVATVGSVGEAAG